MLKCTSSSRESKGCYEFLWSHKKKTGEAEQVALHCFKCSCGLTRLYLSHGVSEMQLDE